MGEPDGIAPRYQRVSRGGDGVRRRHALIVGVDAYDDRSLDLAYCVKDAQRLGAALATRGVDVALLHDGLAPDLLPTAGNVRRALAALVRRGDEDDVLLVHFSCHGQLVDGRPYLLLRDTPGDERSIRERGLPLAEVLTILRGAPRWVAIFFDACHMGLGLDPETVNSTRQIGERAGGFALLAGSTKAQITQDSDERGSGIFTAALIDGLTGAAASPDGSVMFSALAQHVQRAVAAWRRSTEGRDKLSAQTPVMRLEVSDLAILPARDYIALDPGHAGPLAGDDLSNKIRAAAFSPDGRWLATAGEDCTVRLWSPETGRRAQKPLAHQGHVGGVAFSPDSINLATVSNDGYTRLWQAPGASLTYPVPEQQQARVHAVAWSPRDRLVAAVSDRGVMLYDPDAPATPVRELVGHRGTVWCAAFAADGTLVTGGEDGTVRVWDAATGACTQVLDHEVGPVWAVAVSPDGRFIAAGGRDWEAGPALGNVPRAWDRGTGEVACTFRGHTRAVTALAYSRHGERLASASYDGTARIWSASDGQPISVIRAEDAPEAYAVTFSPDDRRLFVGFADGRGRLYLVSPDPPDHVAD